MNQLSGLSEAEMLEVLGRISNRSTSNLNAASPNPAELVRLGRIRLENGRKILCQRMLDVPLFGDVIREDHLAGIAERTATIVIAGRGVFDLPELIVLATFLGRESLVAMCDDCR